MRPEEIESVLKRLKNCEISEDDSTDKEDEIDYYSSQRDRLMELEDEEDVGNFPTDPDLDADPPAVKHYKTWTHSTNNESQQIW